MAASEHVELAKLIDVGGFSLFPKERQQFQKL
jgi:hypothetical protein